MGVRDWLQFWKSYHKRTGALTWRLATGADMPAIRRLRNASERLLRQKQRSLSLFEKPVLLALVAENDKGSIVDCLLCEMQVEVMKVACTKEGFTEGAELTQDLARWLHSIGFKRALIATSSRTTDSMADTLMTIGFRPKQDATYWSLPL